MSVSPLQGLHGYPPGVMTQLAGGEPLCSCNVCNLNLQSALRTGGNSGFKVQKDTDITCMQWPTSGCSSGRIRQSPMLQTGSWAPVCWEPRSRGNSTCHFSPPWSCGWDCPKPSWGFENSRPVWVFCMCVCIREEEPSHAHVSAMWTAQDELISPSSSSRVRRCGPLCQGGTAVGAAQERTDRPLGLLCLPRCSRGMEGD